MSTVELSYECLIDPLFAIAMSLVGFLYSNMRSVLSIYARLCQVKKIHYGMRSYVLLAKFHYGVAVLAGCRLPQDWLLLPMKSKF
jgi:hypothetical protein